MTRSSWLVFIIVAAFLAACAVAWWIAEGAMVDTQPPLPELAAPTQIGALPSKLAVASAASDISAANLSATGPIAAAGGASAPSRIAALPSMIDPQQGPAAAADQLGLSIRFDNSAPVTFDERPQHLLGLREVDADGRTELAVITQDIRSGQIYAWSPSVTFRLREGQTASAVLAGLPQLRNISNFDGRIMGDIDPAAVPVVLRGLAQDGRVSDITLLRIEPRPKAQ